jgi:uncharacterized protein (UPF0276 family)
MIKIGARVTSTLEPIAKCVDLLDYILIEFSSGLPLSDQQRALAAQIRGHTDIVLHGFDSLTTPDAFDDDALSHVRETVDCVGALWLSEHICFAMSRDGLVTTLAAPLTPQSIETICANAIRLRDELSSPLLLENLGRLVVWPWDIVDEVEAIHEILSATGCHLLLDLEQADTSAETRGISLSQYVRLLPLDRVYEVHVGTDEDAFLSVLEEMLSLAPIQAITLEGAGYDHAGTRRQLERLCTLAFLHAR